MSGGDYRLLFRTRPGPIREIARVAPKGSVPAAKSPASSKSGQVELIGPATTGLVQARLLSPFPDHHINFAARYKEQQPPYGPLLPLIFCFVLQLHTSFKHLPIVSIRLRSVHSFETVAINIRSLNILHFFHLTSKSRILQKSLSISQNALLCCCNRPLDGCCQRRSPGWSRGI